LYFEELVLRRASSSAYFSNSAKVQHRFSGTGLGNSFNDSPAILQSFNKVENA
jgi:hypothetical protein